MEQQTKKKNIKIIFELASGIEETEITLKVTLSEDLRNLIRKVAVLDETALFSCQGIEGTRYKIKSVIFSSLGFCRELLFSKKLLDEGYEEFKFYSISTINDVKKAMISDIKVILQNLNKIVKREEININLNGVKNEN